MFLFVIYAVFVWFAALRYRRRVGGIAILCGALFCLHLFNLVHGDIADVIGYDEKVFRGLMYPYMVLVAAVGLYLFSFPRELPRGRVHCRACWFDLSEIEHLGPDTPCPECGTTPSEARSLRGRRTARRRLAHVASPSEIPGIHLSADTNGPDRSASDDTEPDSDQQQSQREPAGNQPAEQ